MKKCILVVSVLLAAISCGRKAPVEVSDAPVKVRVVQVGTTIDNSNNSYVGVVKASKSANVMVKYPGIVERVCVRKGTHVKPGTLIAVISSESVKSSQQIAASTYNYAKDGIDRLNKVKGSGSITEQKYIEAQADYEKAEASLRAANQALSDCEIRAPFSGVVEDVFVETGENVPLGRSVAVISDVGDMDIDIAVPESEVSGMKVGQRVSVKVPALGDKVYSARVKSCGVTASSVSHSYSCQLHPEHIPGLMPGMACSAWVDQVADSIVVVPATAVKTDNKGRFVWVVEEGVVAKRHILVGGYSGSGIIVSEGLRGGDLVVAEGTQKVCTGTQVVYE